jgi:endo-1,4-beta-xylanase
LGVFNHSTISLLLLWTILLAGGTIAQGSVSANGLRFGAQAHGLLVGAAVAVQPLKNDATYAQTLAREFNMVVAENAMKFASLNPNQTAYNFADADAIVDFANAHAMRVRGHTLVWHYQIPQWLINGNFSPSEISTTLKEHIQTVVGHYRGRIYAWDVVNEAIGGDSKLLETIWLKALGPDYIQQAFLWAREADPQAKLFYNDGGGEALGPRSDAIYSLVRNLKARGVPIDGIGLQSHFSVEQPPNFRDITANLNRLTALGLEIHVTELDVSLSMPPTKEKLRQQAIIYRNYLRACLSISKCRAFVMWGFTDKYSWIPSHFAGKGAALSLDEEYNPKPAYNALFDELSVRRDPCFRDMNGRCY